MIWAPKLLERFHASIRSMNPPNINRAGIPIKPEYESQTPMARHAGFTVPNIGITKNKMRVKIILPEVGLKKFFIGKV